jgi:hypothetical protein
MTKFIFIILTLIPKLIFANPLFEKQWGLNNTGQVVSERISRQDFVDKKGLSGFDIKWEKKQYPQNVLVAIIDWGIDYNHPEFEGKLWVNKDCTITEKQNCIGKNFLNPKATVMDDGGHGTHVAGIIGALDNNEGIIGVAPNTELMILKVLDGRVSGFRYTPNLSKVISDYFVEAINFALDNQAQVISISAGFSEIIVNESFDEALDRAMAMNVPIIAASGNNNKEFPVYPCADPRVICVGAVNALGEVSDFSNYGNRVDLLAPGQGILSTFPLELESRNLRLQGYESRSGSSQAAPFVAGVVANLLSKFKQLTVDEIKARIFRSAVPVSDDEKYSIYGLVQQDKAMENFDNFFHPELKVNDEIEIKEGFLDFTYQVNVKKLKGKTPLSFKIYDFEAIGIDFNQKVVESPKMIEGQKEIIKVKAKLKSLGEDFIQRIKFKMSYSGEIRNFETKLSFKLSEDQKSKISKSVSGVDSQAAMVLGEIRNRNTIKYVMHKDSFLKNPEYYFLKRIKGETEKLLITHIAIHPELDAKVSKIELDFNFDEDRLIGFIKGDYNYDQKEDYLIATYRVEKGKVVIYFQFFSSEFDFLFGEKKQSTWRYKHQGVFEFDSDIFEYTRNFPQFKWIKFQHSSLGNISVPLLERNGFIPEKDFVFQFIDKPENRNFKKKRFYTFDLDSNFELSPRILSNSFFRNKIQASLVLRPWDSAQLESFLHNEEALNNASLLLSVGEVFNEKFYRVDFETREKFKVTQIGTPELQHPSFRKIFPMLKNGPEILVLNLNKRFSGELNYIEEFKGNESFNISTGNYKDPLAGFVAASHINDLEVIFESQSYIYYFNKNIRSKVRVNRESSLPRLVLNESLLGVKVKLLDEVKLAAYVDSTILIGDQLYVAVHDQGEKLMRPIGFSLKIPSNCVNLLPVSFQDFDYDFLALSCLEKNNLVFKYFPLKLISK